MKTLTKFVCEVCGTIYDYQASAELCEATPTLSEPLVKIGDTVYFETRYDGVGNDVVVSINLCPNGFNNNLDSYKGDKEKYLKTVESIEETNPKAKGRFLRFHEWVIELKEEHQFGKDSFSKFIGEDALLAVKE